MRGRRHGCGSIAGDATVAFLAALALAGCGSEAAEPPEPGIGDARAGRQAIVRFGCTTCHAIPGVPGPRGIVGPPLEAWSRHPYIAGELPNEPQVLVRWLVEPPALVPDTAMPDSGVTEREARDIAAYLYTLE